MAQIRTAALSAALAATLAVLAGSGPAAAHDKYKYWRPHHHEPYYDPYWSHGPHGYPYGYRHPYVWGNVGGVVIYSDPGRDTRKDGWRTTDGRYQ